MGNDLDLEKRKVLLSLDNCALCVAIGLNRKAITFSEKFGIPYDKITINSLYPNGKATQSNRVNLLFNNLKGARNEKVRLVILPTVLSELFDGKKFKKDSAPDKFFEGFSVEHVIFTRREQKLIDELTEDLLRPIKLNITHDGHTYTKIECPIYGNHNKNHDHDARIVAESCFAGAHLFTFDGDLKNTDLIYLTIKNFQLKHPEETKGFQNFRIHGFGKKAQQNKQPKKQKNYPEYNPFEL